MIINSQFFITHYTGKEPLDLMSIPTEFDGDLLKMQDYNRFIQSIDTIYGSQNLNGEIPKFWTRRVQIVDAMGNIAYTNEPHPESTLTSLASMSSYYFILRDSSDVPVKIPVNGGEVFGFSDISSLPTVSSVQSCSAEVTSTDKCFSIQLTNNNTADLLFNISNLRPYDSYIYEIGTVSANWPISVSPISGIIKPSKTTGVIEINALFCPTTGSCSENVLDYTINDSCLLTDPTKVYGTIQMTLKPVARPDLEIYSDHYSLVCDNCLPPKPKILITDKGGIQSNANYVVENSFNGLPYYDFNIKITQPKAFAADKIYTYSIETLGAEWPIMYVNPTGGLATIRSGESTGMIANKFIFCPTTGLCPPGTGGVPPYSIPSYPKFLLGEDSITGISKITLRASVESYDCPGEKVYSNTSTLSFIESIQTLIDQ